MLLVGKTKSSVESIKQLKQHKYWSLSYLQKKLYRDKTKIKHFTIILTVYIIMMTVWCCLHISHDIDISEIQNLDTWRYSKNHFTILSPHQSFPSIVFRPTLRKTPNMSRFNKKQMYCYTLRIYSDGLFWKYSIFFVR